MVVEHHRMPKNDIELRRATTGHLSACRMIVTVRQALRGVVSADFWLRSAFLIKCLGCGACK